MKTSAAPQKGLKQNKLHFGISCRDMQGHPFITQGNIRLDRGSDSWPIKVAIKFNKFCGGMTIEVTPSYAVNPPYLQHLSMSNRLDTIESNIRRALTAHGEYATEEEIELLLSALPPLLNMMDAAHAMPQA